MRFKLDNQDCARLVHHQVVSVAALDAVERCELASPELLLSLVYDRRIWHGRSMFTEDRVARLCAFVASLPQPKRPPMVVPDAGCAGGAEVFRHLDPAAIPEVAAALEWLMTNRCEVIAAVADVDRTLIWDAMDRTRLANLQVAESLVQDEDALRDALCNVA
ncbi:MAG TPA: hypothetical protein PKE31_20020 [Pseudomonadota bacterium]|nr:hypothetical protein [Pseudomonadota bacterium]